MSGRKIIVDSRSLKRALPAACPECGVALSSVQQATLRPISHNIFRCPPGQHPRAFEARCGGCGRLLILVKSDDGLSLVPGDQDALLKSIRETERAHVEHVKHGDREL